MSLLVTCMQAFFQLRNQLNTLRSIPKLTVLNPKGYVRHTLRSIPKLPAAHYYNDEAMGGRGGTSRHLLQKRPRSLIRWEHNRLPQNKSVFAGVVLALPQDSCLMSHTPWRHASNGRRPPAPPHPNRDCKQASH